MVSAIRIFFDWSTASARGVDNRTSSPKTRQIHRIHGIGDRGSVAVFLESSINSSNGSPRILSGLLRDRLDTKLCQHRCVAKYKIAQLNGHVYADIYRAELN